MEAKINTAERLCKDRYGDTMVRWLLKGPGDRCEWSISSFTGRVWAARLF
jgi:hypothetical protein